MSRLKVKRLWFMGNKNNYLMTVSFNGWQARHTLKFCSINLEEEYSSKSENVH